MLETETVPPCRVLFRNGQPCNEIVTMRERSNVVYGRCFSIESKPRPLPEEKPKRGRPRIHPPKPKPHVGEGKAWNRMPEVSVEKILELQAKGMTADQIGAELGCTRFTVYGRLRANRRSSPEAARQDAAIRTCQCGRNKWPGKQYCGVCNSARNKREIRMTLVPRGKK